MGLGFTEIEITQPLLSWKEFGLEYFINFKLELLWEKYSKRFLDSSEKKILFSYWELDKDTFLKNPRIELLNRIIQHLPYKDQIFLWPLCVFLKDKMIPCEELFYKGISYTKAKILILFGEKIFKYLFPKMTLQYKEFTINNLKVLPLPSLDKMLPDNRKIKKFVWNKLINIKV